MPGKDKAAIWDEYSVTYDASRLCDPVYMSCIKQAANEIPKGTRVCLDAGCGTGLSTIAIHANCDKVFAVDHSKESLKLLEKRGIRNVATAQSNLESLPFEDSFFDAAICANTLQHFKPNGSQGRAIAELRRVTKKDGIICVSVHHFSNPKRKAGWLKEGQAAHEVDYVFRFSRDELLGLMPSATIKGVGYYGLLKLPFFGSRLQNAVADLFGNFLGACGYGHMLVAIERNVKPGTASEKGL